MGYDVDVMGRKRESSQPWWSLVWAVSRGGPVTMHLQWQGVCVWHCLKTPTQEDLEDTAIVNETLTFTPPKYSCLMNPKCLAENATIYDGLRKCDPS